MTSYAPVASRASDLRSMPRLDQEKLPAELDEPAGSLAMGEIVSSLHEVRPPQFFEMKMRPAGPAPISLPWAPCPCAICATPRRSCCALSARSATAGRPGRAPGVHHRRLDEAQTPTGTGPGTEPAQRLAVTTAGPGAGPGNARHHGCTNCNWNVNGMSLGENFGLWSVSVYSLAVVRMKSESLRLLVKSRPTPACLYLKSSSACA
jgi:hypothetical protein